MNDSLVRIKVNCTVVVIYTNNCLIVGNSLYYQAWYQQVLKLFASTQFEKNDIYASHFIGVGFFFFLSFLEDRSEERRVGKEC